MSEYLRMRGFAVADGQRPCAAAADKWMASQIWAWLLLVAGVWAVFGDGIVEAAESPSIWSEAIELARGLGNPVVVVDDGERIYITGGLTCLNHQEVGCGNLEESDPVILVLEPDSVSSTRYIARAFELPVKHVSQEFLFPHLAVDSHRNLHVVWTSHPAEEGYDGSDRRVFYAKFGPDGDLLVPPQRVDQRGWLDPGQLALDAKGRAHVVWNDMSGRLHYLKIDEEGRAGTPVELVHEWAAKPSVAVDHDGMVHLVWAHRTEQTTDLTKPGAWEEDVADHYEVRYAQFPSDGPAKFESVRTLVEHVLGEPTQLITEGRNGRLYLFVRKGFQDPEWSTPRAFALDVGGMSPVELNTRFIDKDTPVVFSPDGRVSAIFSEGASIDHRGVIHVVRNALHETEGNPESYDYGITYRRTLTEAGQSLAIANLPSIVYGAADAMDRDAYFRAVHARNPELCAEIKDTRMREYYCYSMFASELRDIELCEKASTVWMKQSCITDVARQTHNAELCARAIESDEFGESCYGVLAREWRQPTLCERPMSKAHRSECYLRIAEAMADRAWCERITDSERKASCVAIVP